MDIRWLLRDKKGFLDFVPTLEKFERDNLFQTDFLKSLTHEYWMVYLKKIIVRTLIPWVFYSALCLLYFTHTLHQNFEMLDSGAKFGWRAVGWTILVLVYYMLLIEVKQVIQEGADYFKSLYNYVDLLQYIGTIYVIVTNILDNHNTSLHLSEHHGASMSEKRNLCAFVVISQGMKAIVDWLRLFDSTSFYVTLILRTFVDILYFMLIMLILLFYFGIAMYMLQLNADPAERSTFIIEAIFGNVLIDSTLN